MREQKPVVSSHRVCDLQLQQPLGGQCSLTAHPSLATHLPISAGHQQQTSHHLGFQAEDTTLLGSPSWPGVVLWNQLL